MSYIFAYSPVSNSKKVNSCTSLNNSEHQTIVNSQALTRFNTRTPYRKAVSQGRTGIICQLSTVN